MSELTRQSNLQERPEDAARRFARESLHWQMEAERLRLKLSGARLTVGLLSLAFVGELVRVIVSG
jgi:hypothetical protein